MMSSLGRTGLEKITFVEQPESQGVIPVLRWTEERTLLV